jgi:hypothetical protein
LGGIKEGDFIVEITGVDAKWFDQKQVLDLLKVAGNNLGLKVVTPMDNKSHSNSKVLISKLTQNSYFQIFISTDPIATRWFFRQTIQHELLWNRFRAKFSDVNHHENAGGKI